ncbi:MAG: hypothetical protein A2848_01370 [Candidatus Magasanikbacteria bacterium RIFCSPHIGHO2_01_FULL_50_8]|uniref:Uncharacterized protein n=2 Tax=Candidatus Magasanikiibacteriota TaxID=1752731 RepID=A0A1F6LRX4_9BACT|nr:MAG: hypothetical protein A2848_01370 [Candidatus Magasanikbacteria bacterium RIFCSPHIGHO2_01_FULL_50_8]OGH67833.1 MAG: hypothetical protein A3C15_02125 [Candidatus Magasanikbacteria bacterium RIFCSPHIGHO2_02_FULL_50_9b]
MLTFPTQGLGESIVRELKQGQLENGELINRLQQKNPRLTLQGIYKALRALRASGIVFMERKQTMLNIRWLQELDSFTSLAEHAYRDPRAGSGHFLQLQDGDRITYSFKNAVQVDAFWNHVLYILFEALPSLDRWYAYASHCWWLLGRREEELVLRDFMTSRGIKYLFTVGHHTPLDRAIAKDFDNTMSQYHMRDEPLFRGRANFLGIVLNVIGDFVIEAQYDKRTTERLEKFYAEHSNADTETIAALEQLVALPAKIKFSITRSRVKAEKITRSFTKNFHVKSGSGYR